MATRGMQPTRVRLSNQRAVHLVVARESGVSNADISRRTGLAPQTVSAVLADLEDMGILTRGAARRGGGRGQPATPVYVNPDGAYCVGIEIGWERLDVLLMDLSGRIVEREMRTHSYPDGRTIFGEIGRIVARMVGTLSPGARGRLIGAGLAMPEGLGDAASLIVPPAGQQEAWAGVDAVAETARATGLEVHGFNDGNAACWVEYASHAAPRPGNFVYLLIDTFVGAGLVAENRMWEGPTGRSANLGSMLVSDRSGRPRFVHEVASLHALRGRLAGIGATLADIESGTPPAELGAIVDTWIDDASFALAQTILNAATVIDSEFAVIDAMLPAALRARVVEQVRERMVQAPSLGRGSPPVRAGRLGRPAAAEGAALLRLYRRHLSREPADMELD